MASDKLNAIFGLGAVIQLTLDEAHTGHHQGACDDDVAYLARLPHIVRQLDDIGHEAMAAELAEYGAWDADELADENATRERFLWVACGNIVDEYA